MSREELRGEAVAPLYLAEECLAVVGVANRTRRDCERALGSECFGGAPVVGEDVAHARDRNGEQAAALVDAFAEPRDARFPLDVADFPGVDVRDEQPRRVRPDVDGRHSAHVVDASGAWVESPADCTKSAALFSDSIRCSRSALSSALP